MSFLLDHSCLQKCASDSPGKFNLDIPIRSFELCPTLNHVNFQGNLYRSALNLTCCPQDVLHKAGQPIAAEGIEYETKVIESGHIQEAICSAAKELGATMVVMGGREMGIVQRTLLGSIRYAV